MTQSLNIKTKTWERDSYGLFDFEAKNLHTSKLDMKETSTIFRKDCHISLHKGNSSSCPELKNNTARRESAASDIENLATIKKDKGEFVLHKGTEENLEIFQVLQSNHSECRRDIALKEGDLFKLGRISFKILKVFFNFTKATIRRQRKQEE